MPTVRTAFVLPLVLSVAAWIAVACGGGGNGAGPSGLDAATASDTSVGSDGAGKVDSGKPSDAAADAHVDAGVDAADAAFVTASHPRQPVIVQQRGVPAMNPHITSVTFTNTYQEKVSDLDAFVSGVVQQPYWSATTSEYGIGTATVEAPQHLAEAAPATATDADVQVWLADKIASGAPGFADATDDSLFVLFYPASSVLTDGKLQPCTDFLAYHSSAAVPLEAGTIYPAYAAILECPVPDAGPVTTALESVTTSASHEMVEAVTDPHGNHIGGSPPYPGFLGTAKGSWSFDQYAAYPMVNFGYYAYLEVADMCVDVRDSVFTPSGFPYMVQRSWSNAAALGGHDPCVPYLPSASPFFLAQAVYDPNYAADEAMSPPTALPLVNFKVGSSTDQTQGLHAAVGGSAMVPLILWSDAPVPDWNVVVVDPFSYPAASPYLSFALDKSTGNNGDVVHLTVTVKSVDSTYGGHPFLIASTDGVHEHWSLGFMASP